jgi:hypothetical protein
MSHPADLWTLLADLFLRVNICLLMRGSLLLAHGPFSFSITPSPSVGLLLLATRTNIYNDNHHINTLASRTDLYSTRWPFSASHASRFESQRNGHLPVTRGPFSFQRIFSTIKYGPIHNARKPCWLTGILQAFWTWELCAWTFFAHVDFSVILCCWPSFLSCAKDYFHSLSPNPETASREGGDGGDGSRKGIRW